MPRIIPHSSFTILILLALGLLCAMQLYTPPAYAIGAFNPPPQELALLPAYCGPRAEKWGNNSSHPEVARWISVFGSDYKHMHHYCITLQAINQARFSMDEKKRASSYLLAMNNLEYMEKAVAPNFVLWPEMLLNRARIEEGRGNIPAAIQSLQKAIAHKADYPLPYAELADIYKKLNMTTEARNVVEAGLEANPGSHLLQRRLNCLDNPGDPRCH
jgi:tetratricopeptide (TPR) repeat protein